MERDELLKGLLKKRDGYEADLIWEKFLLDAYAGTGGFQGKVRLPLAGFWGAGAGIYNRGWLDNAADESEIDTYLDRFPREDIAKFERRAAMAHYTNPVEPIVDIRLSYLHRRAPTYVKAERVDAFRANADGQGRSWDALLHDTIHVRAEVLGWCPVLFDMPSAGPVASRAEALERGIAPYAVPLFPGQVYDWAFERGTLKWAKIGTWFEERADALGPVTKVHEVAIWYRDRVETYEIVKGENARDEVRASAVRPHPWGEVPLRSCVHKPSQLPLRGLSQIGSVAKLAKRQFNYLSELDEHLRSSTFALLQVPTNDPDKIGTVLGGAGNALPIRHDSSVEYKFLNPDTSIPAVYEARIAATDKAIERNAKTGYSANESKQVQSGISKAFSFENMNRSLADTAKHQAAFDQSCLRLVARMDGASDDEVGAIIVSPQTRFDVEELAAELENALAARSLPIGPTAVAEMTKRLVRQLLPNLDPDKLAKIDAEVDQLALEAEQAAAAARAALGGEPADDDDGAEDDEDDDTDAAA